MKSQFFPGGRNYKLLLIFSLVAIACTQASAIIITEDFEYTKPSSNTYDNGIFHHNIITVSPSANSWDIGVSNSSGADFDNNALNLWFTQDIITFNLTDGQYIDSISIDYLNLEDPKPEGTTWVQVYGETGMEEILPPSVGSWNTFVVTSNQVGNIETVLLGSYDGAFDNIQVNVVPEPMTLSLLGLGGMMLRRRSRK